MSHLDEGTLHALLDGELETNEVGGIQAHLSSCSACGLRLREVKEFLAEADRLIASVELGASVGAAPGGATPVAATALGATPMGTTPAPMQREAAASSEPIARAEAPPRREPAVRRRPSGEAQANELWNQPPPMLLIPDNESVADRRMRRLRRVGWAALFVGMVGAGILGVYLRPETPGLIALGPRSPAASDAVVSPEESARPDSDALAADAPSRTLAAKSAPAARPSPVRAPPTAAGARGRTEGQRQPADRSSASRELAAVARKDSEPDVETIDSTAEAESDIAASDSAAVEDITTVRARAAEALANLDRDRLRNQAAAATAALDAERRRRGAAPTAAAATAAAPVPPPAPPTLEQRSQVYLRIGLDEASRQLGGPVHVIEGLSPMFMGLVRGPTVAGSDATRPVVRVVYQDSQGRLILLDQQRLRVGQSPPAARPLAWLIGQTAMWLNGEASGDILRTYRPRVR